MSEPETPWSFAVGFLPNKVTAKEELTRGGVVYLWWRANKQWKKLSLHRGVRTKRGALDKEAVAAVKLEAEAAYARLVAKLPVQEQAAAAALLATGPLTLGATQELITDKLRGQYPGDTPHRREVLRSLAQAVTVLGAGTAWNALKPMDLTALWRARIIELGASPKAGAGVRGAEIAVTRLLAIASWLREQGKIEPGACLPPKEWHKKLREDWRALRRIPTDATKHRPRHTIEETLAILEHAKAVDPRCAFLLGLGAELRLGQVRRARRRDLQLERGIFTVASSGHKRGQVVDLTPGQIRLAREVLTTGYLRELERGAADYPLFPGGTLACSRPSQRKHPRADGYTEPTATVARHAQAKPIDRTAMRKWFRKIETLAKIPHAKGRGWYGLRRQLVDAAKREKISREGLQQHGGWTDTQMPDAIYAEQEMEYARQEAMRVRAKIRGEPEPGEKEAM